MKPEDAKLQLIKEGCKNLWIDSSIMGKCAEDLYFQRDDFNKIPTDPSWFNEGFPFRIWRDSGIGYALNRGRPEYGVDGQARTVSEALNMAGSDGVIVMARPSRRYKCKSCGEKCRSNKAERGRDTCKHCEL